VVQIRRIGALAVRSHRSCETTSSYVGDRRGSDSASRQDRVEARRFGESNQILLGALGVSVGQQDLVIAVAIEVDDCVEANGSALMHALDDFGVGVRREHHAVRALRDGSAATFDHDHARGRTRELSLHHSQHPGLTVGRWKHDRIGGNHPSREVMAQW
jgi:hypothetical protein